MKALLRRILFQNRMVTLTVLLSLGQLLIAHWVIVVLAGGDRPGVWPITGALCVLVAGNLGTMGVLRRARRRAGWPRRAARLYMAGGLATLLVGLAVAVAWIGVFPITHLIAAAELSRLEAFDLFRGLSAALVLALVTMVLWGFTGGQRRVEHTRIRIPVKGLDAAHRGLRIVQISDLHIGNGFEEKRLRSVVGELNAMAPDIVALTGDLFDFDPAFIEQGARHLGELRAKLGVYAVLGNHDRYTGAEEVAAALGTLAPEIKLLREEVVRLPLPAPLYLAGVDDPEQDWTARGVHVASLERLARTLPQDGPVLLLVHRPELFPQAARLGFPLVLAGHTHGGQLALPTPGGRFNLARIITPFHRGLYRADGSVLYVNRGLGVAGPAIRFNCPREIATIELA